MNKAIEKIVQSTVVSLDAVLVGLTGPITEVRRESAIRLWALADDGEGQKLFTRGIKERLEAALRDPDRHVVYSIGYALRALKRTVRISLPRIAVKCRSRRRRAPRGPKPSHMKLSAQN